MKNLKNLAYRILILFACVGFVMSYSSCESDEKDKELLFDQTFLEKYDNSKWTIIEDEMRIYLRLNDDMDKAVEIWTSELEFSKLLVAEECFYYTAGLLNTEEVEILENSETKLEFTYQGNETWTFSMDGDRLKLVYKTMNATREPIYFSKTTQDFGALTLCPEDDSEKGFRLLMNLMLKLYPNT